MPESAAAVLLAGLGFRYRTRRQPALRHVDLRLERGETLVVLGPSGSGKSTLALCLNGLIPHQIPGDLSGVAVVAGLDIRATEPGVLARTVGLVFQDPETQFCHLIAEDEVAFGLENLRVPREAMPDRIDAALAAAGLAGLGRRRVERLSGGQKQRLALAAVLVMDPPILVFDEPTANLDPLGARDLFERIGRLRGERTMVIVEHRVEHALALADRVLVLGPDGSPLALGPPREVLRRRWDDLRRFGVWLPEVAALALALDPAAGAAGRPLPLTVDDAATALATVRPPASAAPAAPRPPSPPAVRVRGLTFAYAGGDAVLDDVRCELPQGRLSAVVGPNGSGKSTLVAHLCGILRPRRGVVDVLGRDGYDLARRPQPDLVGFVFQNPEHQFLTNRVFDEVAWGPRRARLPEPEVRLRTEDELARLGLEHLAGASPYKLSGGEKRRLSLATALVLRPRLLVLDEPTFGQDANTTADLLRRLRHLLDSGTTVVIVTHDMRLLATRADHVLALVRGRVAYEGPPAGLLSDSALLAAGHLLRPPLLDLARRLDPATTPAPALAALDAWFPAGDVPPAPAPAAGSGVRA